MHIFWTNIPNSPQNLSAYIHPEWWYTSPQSTIHSRQKHTSIHVANRTERQAGKLMASTCKELAVHAMMQEPRTRGTAMCCRQLHPEYEDCGTRKKHKHVPTEHSDVTTEVLHLIVEQAVLLLDGLVVADNRLRCQDLLLVVLACDFQPHVGLLHALKLCDD